MAIARRAGGAPPRLADADEALVHLRQAEATLMALELTSHGAPPGGADAES